MTRIVWSPGQRALPSQVYRWPFWTTWHRDNGRVSNGVLVVPPFSNEWAWPDGYPYISKGPHGMGMDVPWPNGPKQSESRAGFSWQTLLSHSGLNQGGDPTHFDNKTAETGQFLPNGRCIFSPELPDVGIFLPTTNFGFPNSPTRTPVDQWRPEKPFCLLVCRVSQKWGSLILGFVPRFGNPKNVWFPDVSSNQP